LAGVCYVKNNLPRHSVLQNFPKFKTFAVALPLFFVVADDWLSVCFSGCVDV